MNLFSMSVNHRVLLPLLCPLVPPLLLLFLLSFPSIDLNLSGEYEIKISSMCILIVMEVMIKAAAEKNRGDGKLVLIKGSH